ncbi:hypothetical protein MKW98_023147 [Papaver atlanticum]|uniref:Uncharacterized protein n=1 Tax=Papaver atlanticum TaxID=357466 RepID=A0AAD4TBX1_9MAGN|nr:hypothetical protein MKW98_023147 [Papaver atlanticum]
MKTKGKRLMKLQMYRTGNEGRGEGKSVVLKLLRAYDRLPRDVNYAKTCICLNSLLKLFQEGVAYKNVDREIALVADNLLWLLDILADRKVAE